MEPVQDADIWVLDDDEGSVSLYREVLGLLFDVTYHESLEALKTALERVARGELARPDMIIADLLLGDGDLLSFLRSTHAPLVLSCRLLCVSSVDDLDSLRQCYAAGAIDYLVKPFNRNELIARIERALQTEREEGGAAVEDDSAVRVGEVVVRGLTAKERQLLALFVGSPGYTVDRETILTRAWTRGYVQPKTVDVHLYNLRRKLRPYRLFIHSTGKGRWSLRDDKGWRPGAAERRRSPGHPEEGEDEVSP